MKHLRSDPFNHEYQLTTNIAKECGSDTKIVPVIAAQTYWFRTLLPVAETSADQSEAVGWYRADNNNNNNNNNKSDYFKL